MIDEKRLIEELLNIYLVNNDGTWNDAIDKAVSLVKELPIVTDAKIEELKAEIACLRKEHDEARKGLAKLEEKARGLYELPAEPIDCATMLINATIEYENSPFLKAIKGQGKSRTAYYSPDELRQIAEHLLVYCNHVESEL